MFVLDKFAIIAGNKLEEVSVFMFSLLLFSSVPWYLRACSFPNLEGKYSVKKRREKKKKKKEKKFCSNLNINQLCVGKVRGRGRRS